jgi:hypothetical protein
MMAIIGITGSHIHAFPGDSYFWFWNGVLIGLWAKGNGIEAPEEPYEITSDA